MKLNFGIRKLPAYMNISFTNRLSLGHKADKGLRPHPTNNSNPMMVFNKG